MASFVLARQAWTGTFRHGKAGHGRSRCAGRGRAGTAWQGLVVHVEAWCGRRGLARHGRVRHGTAWQAWCGLARLVWLGPVRQASQGRWLGEAGLGLAQARLGQAGHVRVGPGSGRLGAAVHVARSGWAGEARLGAVWQGGARYGMAGSAGALGGVGPAWQLAAGRIGLARRGMARRGLVCLGGAGSAGCRLAGCVPARQGMVGRGWSAGWSWFGGCRLGTAGRHGLAWIGKVGWARLGRCGKGEPPRNHLIGFRGGSKIEVPHPARLPFYT